MQRELEMVRTGCAGRSRRGETDRGDQHRVIAAPGADRPCMDRSRSVRERQAMIETTPSGRSPSPGQSSSIPHSGRGEAQGGRPRWRSKHGSPALRPVAACGIPIVCYNFMPVDWTWNRPRPRDRLRRDGDAFRPREVRRLRSFHSAARRPPMRPTPRRTRRAPASPSRPCRRATSPTSPVTSPKPCQSSATERSPFLNFATGSPLMPASMRHDCAGV